MRALCRLLWTAAPLLLGLACTPLQAATIELGDGKPCGIKLSGEIVEGDAERLKGAIEKHDRGYSVSALLCLDSPGGSFAEGLAMVKTIVEAGHIASYIDDGAQCYSACALVFLAGSVGEGGYESPPDRTMHVRAKLGLHAPFGAEGVASSEQAAKAYYDAGLGAVNALMDTLPQDLLPDSLRRQMMQHMGGESDIFEIDTLDQAGRWKIKLAGYQPPQTLTAQMAQQGCHNKDSWESGEEAVGDGGRPAPPLPSDTTKDGLRRLTIKEWYGPEGGLDCFITARSGKTGLLIDIDIESTDEYEVRDPGLTPSWYLFSPAMKLAAIPVGPSSDQAEFDEALEFDAAGAKAEPE
jgi:hypothetical protein